MEWSFTKKIAEKGGVYCRLYSKKPIEETQRCWLCRSQDKCSHHVLRKEGNMLITVPVHGNKDIPKGTYEKILKDAGLK